jgi:iron(III) transport system permease protein
MGRAMTASLEILRRQNKPHAAVLQSFVAAKLRSFAAEPAKLFVLAGALLILGGLILYPLALLVKFGLTNANGVPTLRPVITAFSEPGILKATGNSALLGIYVTAGALALGLPLAWLVARTDIPGKALIRIAAAVAFVVPSFITVIAWLFLAAPNSGLLNTIAGSMLGTETPVFNIVSFGGLVFIEIAHLYPLVFFAVSAALSNVDPSYEQVARVLGAGRLRTMLVVTMPLVKPAIVSSAILVMLDALSSFGAPAAIGTMANFSVLTTKIYQLLSFPPRLELAAAISIPIVVFTLFCLLLQRQFVKDSRYRTLSGKAGSAQPVRLNKARIPALLFCTLVFAVTSILPLIALAVLSLLTAYGADVTWQNMTLNNFEMIADPTFSVFDAVNHSIFLSAVSAAVCIVLGVLFAWFVERTAIFGRGLVTVTILIAYGFPAVAFAVAVMLGYLSLLYGTFSILLIAYVAKKLPISFVLFRSGLKQITPDLEEAARVGGAGWVRTVTQITLPLLKSSIWAAALLIFALGLRELPMSAILSQPNTQVMSTKVMEYLETGAVELAAAMALIIVALSLFALVLSKAISGRSTLEVE